MSIERTHEWFQEAVKTPTSKTQRVQLGVHVEEFVEMLDAMDLPKQTAQLEQAKNVLNLLANALKKDPDTTLVIKDRKEFLDALVDQVVTATGTGYMQGMDVPGGLFEVNSSNFSKFVDGKAVFDENGKIAKGPMYFKPNLDKFVGTDPTV